MATTDNELKDFLASVDPSFVKYAQPLLENGLSGKQDFGMMQEKDYQYLSIPLFHWRKILEKAKATSSTKEESETPEGNTERENEEVGQESVKKEEINQVKKNQSPSPSPNVVTKVAGWGDEEVSLWVRTLENGKYREYSKNFETRQIDGAKLVEFSVVKDLSQLVPDLGDRHSLFEQIEQLKSGTVPSIHDMLEKDRRLQKEERKEKEKEKIEVTNVIISQEKSEIKSTSTTAIREDPLFSSSSPKVESSSWAPQSTILHSKASKQNLIAKPKEESSVRQRLIKFYEIYNPSKLEDEAGIDEVLRRYQGHENDLFADLEQKYILGGGQKVSYKRKELNRNADSRTDALLRELSNLYHKYARHVEEAYQFPVFHTSLLNPVDFTARPMVMLVGQYSTGKTTFIRYLIGRDFPGMSIGPEPTTDCFSAIMYGNDERLVPGHTVSMDTNKPFRSLTTHGAGFLNKFNCVEVPSPLLESITFVDTPGILSGEKQRLGRNYEFSKVVEWFAHRSDRIILLFDAHKLDISDEFKASIEMLKGHDDKIRCVLNKADSVNNQALLRIYGALMWSLGKVFKTPEVLRVYVGSFWDQPYSNDHNAALFDSEADDLLSDLRSLPRHSATRKINEFVKRTRQLRVHCMIIEHMRKQFGMFGKERTQQKLLDNLRDEFRTIAKEEELNLNDFPNPDKFRELIQTFDISKFPKLNKKWKEGLDEVLTDKIPELMRKIPSNTSTSNEEKDKEQTSNPFAIQSDPEASLDPTKTWIVNAATKAKYDTKFYSLAIQSGKASTSEIYGLVLQSGLSREVLKIIWDLSDIDQDGKMDSEEFALCMYLIDLAKAGNKIPTALPVHFIPPGKRNLVEFE